MWLEGSHLFSLVAEPLETRGKGTSFEVARDVPITFKNINIRNRGIFLELCQLYSLSLFTQILINNYVKYIFVTSSRKTIVLLLKLTYLCLLILMLLIKLCIEIMLLILVIPYSSRFLKIKFYKICNKLTQLLIVPMKKKINFKTLGSRIPNDVILE